MPITDGDLKQEPEQYAKWNEDEHPRGQPDNAGEFTLKQAPKAGKKLDFEPAGGTQQTLFQTQGQKGQKNLFWDKAVPDELLSREQREKRRQEEAAKVKPEEKPVPTGLEHPLGDVAIEVGAELLQKQFPHGATDEKILSSAKADWSRNKAAQKSFSSVDEYVPHVVEAYEAKQQAIQDRERAAAYPSVGPTTQGTHVQRISNDEAMDGDWDKWEAGLGSEAMMAKMADGMKGIEGREYAIREHSPGKWQIVSRKPKEEKPEQADLDAQAVANMLPGSKRAHERDAQRRAKWDAGQEQRDAKINAHQPQWSDADGGLKSPHSPYVAIPTNGKKNAARWSIVDPDGGHEITQLNKDEVHGWLAKRSMDAKNDPETFAAGRASSRPEHPPTEEQRPAPKDIKPAAAPDEQAEHWYGMHNRPIGHATVPKGMSSTKPHEAFRHGSVAYPRKLTDQEIYDFELTPIRHDSEIPDVAKAVAETMGDYVGEYLKPENEETLNHKFNQPEVRKVLGHVDLEKVKDELRKQHGATGEAEAQPLESAVEHDPSHVAVAKRFGIPPEAVKDVLETHPDELAKRDDYGAPSSGRDDAVGPTLDYPKHKLGSAKIGSMRHRTGETDEAYVDYLREFDPHNLKLTEPEDGMKTSGSVQAYVDWLKAGHKPPPIEAFDSANGNGDIVSTNRRRVLAAQMANAGPIVGWHGVENKETGLPLKFGDIKRAHAELTQSNQETSGQFDESLPESFFTRKISNPNVLPPLNPPADLADHREVAKAIAYHVGEGIIPLSHPDSTQDLDWVINRIHDPQKLINRENVRTQLRKFADSMIARYKDLDAKIKPRAGGPLQGTQQPKTSGQNDADRSPWKVGQRVSLSGSEPMHVLEVRKDGTLRVSPTGKEEDSFLSESGERIRDVDVSPNAPFVLPDSREEYVQGELDKMKQARNEQLQSVESEIAKQWKPANLPTGIDPVQHFLSQDRVPKDLRHLATKHRVARQNLMTDTRLDEEKHGRVYDQLKAKQQSANLAAAKQGQKTVQSAAEPPPPPAEPIATPTAGKEYPGPQEGFDYDPKGVVRAGEAMKAGEAMGVWRHHVGRAYVHEHIGEDHPAWADDVGIRDYIDGQQLYGQHVRTWNGKPAKVTDIRDDGKALIVTHEDGSTSVQSPQMDHLGAYLNDKLKRDKHEPESKVPHSEAARYMAKQVAAQALKENRSAFTILKEHGIQERHMPFFRMIEGEIDKQREAAKPKPSEARTKAQQRRLLADAASAAETPKPKQKTLFRKQRYGMPPPHQSGPWTDEDERKHPRDHGKFSSKPGASGEPQHDGRGDEDLSDEDHAAKWNAVLKNPHNADHRDIGHAIRFASHLRGHHAKSEHLSSEQRQAVMDSIDGHVAKLQGILQTKKASDARPIPTTPSGDNRAAPSDPSVSTAGTGRQQPGGDDPRAAPGGEDIATRHATASKNLELSNSPLKSLLESMLPLRDVRKHGSVQTKELGHDYAKQMYNQLLKPRDDGFGETHDLSDELGHGAMGYASPAGNLVMIPPKFKTDDWDVRFTLPDPSQVDGGAEGGEGEQDAPSDERGDAWEPPAEEPAELQPWQMSRGEFHAQEKSKPGYNVAATNRAHRQAVNEAMAAGHPVSQEATQDYPEFGGRHPEFAPSKVSADYWTKPKEKPKRKQRVKRGVNVDSRLGQIISEAVGDDPEQQEAFGQLIDEIYTRKQHEVVSRNGQLRELIGMFVADNQTDDKPKRKGAVSGQGALIRAIKSGKFADPDDFQKNHRLGGQWDSMVEYAQKYHPELLQYDSGESSGKGDDEGALWNRLHSGLEEVPAKDSDEVIEEAMSHITGMVAARDSTQRRMEQDPEYRRWAEELAAVPFSRRGIKIRYQLAAKRLSWWRKYGRQLSLQWTEQDEQKHPRDDHGAWTTKNDPPEHRGARDHGSWIEKHGQESNEQLSMRAKHGDRAAMSLLLSKNQGLVYRVAKRFAGGDADRLDDLTQEGNMALMRAAESYDPSLGAKFSTYATWWIKSRIARANSKAAGRAASMQFDDGESFDPLDEGAEQPGDAMDDSELSARLSDELSKLDERHAEIVRKRFGLEGRDEHQLKDLADEYGVSPQRVQQIISASLNKLRHAVAHYEAPDDPIRYGKQMSFMFDEDEHPRATESVSIDGTDYTPGEWIPKDAAEDATPAQAEKIDVVDKDTGEAKPLEEHADESNDDDLDERSSISETPAIPEATSETKGGSAGERRPDVRGETENSRSPWQMTRGDWHAQERGKDGYDVMAANKAHRLAVEEAIESGEDVPPEAYRDYPILREMAESRIVQPAVPSEPPQETLAVVNAQQQLFNAGVVDAPPTPSAKATATVAAAVDDSIRDFGEKIGGARKDLVEGKSPSKRVVDSDSPEGAEEPDDDRETWRKRYDVAMDSSTGKYQIYDMKTQTRWGGHRLASRQSFASREEAEAMVPMVAVARNHRVGNVGTEEEPNYAIYREVTDRKRPVVKDGFATHEDAMKYMATNPKEIIEFKTRIDGSIHPKLDQVVRDGPEYREGERDAKPSEFHDKFGFRGVEFGNWNNQLERQVILDHAFDSFKDLAHAINMPERAVSLNGELALAFGARGHGLHGAQAHYEPDYAVINLTKLHGAGALAHEWWHALDHYIGRASGMARTEKAANQRGDLVYQGVEDHRRIFPSNGFNHSATKLRPELKDAFKDVMDAIQNRSVQYTEDESLYERRHKKISEALGEHLSKVKADFSKDFTDERYTRYKGKKAKPASPEVMKEVEELCAKIEAGDMGERVEVDTGGRVPIGLPANIARLSELHKQLRGNRGFYKDNNGRLAGTLVEIIPHANSKKVSDAMLKDAREKKVKDKKVPTDFVAHAQRMDRGAVKDEWSLHHELAARAFESYVYDKIKGASGRNDFLAYESHNNLFMYRLLGVKPYPEGEERSNMNAAFDKLFNTLRPSDFGLSDEEWQPRPIEAKPSEVSPVDPHEGALPTAQPAAPKPEPATPDDGWNSEPVEFDDGSTMTKHRSADGKHVIYDDGQGKFETQSHKGPMVESIGTFDSLDEAKAAAAPHKPINSDIVSESFDPDKHGGYKPLLDVADTIRSGEMKAEDYKQQYAFWRKHGDAHIADLQQKYDAKTLQNIAANSGDPFNAKRNSKSQNAKSVYQNLLRNAFHVSDSGMFQYGMDGPMVALDKHVESHTDESLAKAISSKAAKSEAESAADKRAIENPQTISDFRTAIKSAGGYANLPEEHKARYDDLIASERRKNDTSRKSTVEGFTGKTGDIGIVEGHHQKHNKPTWTVTIAERLGDDWDQAISRARQLGGNYVNAKVARMYRATPGFQFFSREAADKMVNVLKGGTEDRSDILDERRVAKIDNAAERLHAIAELTKQRAQEALDRPRQTNTSRRADMASSAEGQARSEKAKAETLARIAEGLAEGKLQHLQGIRAKTHMEELDSVLGRSRYDRFQEATRAENRAKSGHSNVHWEDFNAAPMSSDDVNAARYPYPRMWANDLSSMADEFADVPGLKKLAKSIKGAADTSPYKKKLGNIKLSGGQALLANDLKEIPLASHLVKDKAVRVHATTDQKLLTGRHDIAYTADLGKSWATTPDIAVAAALNRGHDLDIIDPPQDKLIDIKDESTIADLGKAISKLRRNPDPRLRRVAENLKGHMDSYNRLQAMDVKSVQELRAALREYMPLKVAREKVDPVKVKERALVGTKIPGFFPTPRPLAEKLVSAADIQPGMSVLEPSAGKGDLMDVVKDSHPDAELVGIEPQSKLRDILQTKGHSLADDGDFLEHSGQYDRIVMNPPFENRADVKHVRHAYDQLKPGGRLVAIMSSGPFHGSSKADSEFRDWLEETGAEIEDNPEGSFSGTDAFRQTGVNTKMVIVSKPNVESVLSNRDSLSNYKPADPSHLKGKSVFLWHGTTVDNARRIATEGRLKEGSRGRNASGDTYHASQYPEDTGADAMILLHAATGSLEIDPNDQQGGDVESGLFPSGSGTKPGWSHGHGSSATVGQHSVAAAFDLSEADDYQKAIEALQTGDFERAKTLGVKIITKPAD